MAPDDPTPAAPTPPPVMEIVPAPPGSPGAPPTPGGTLGVPPPPAPDPTPAPTPPKAGDPSPTPTPAPVPPKAAPTVASGAPKPGDDPPTPATWPDDWRDKLAGDNKKFRARLDRMGSPADLAKSFLSIEQKMSAGELKKALPNNATAEEIAEYRKDNDIPEAPDGYDVKIDGMVWGDYDKPHVDSWTKFAHENNMTPREVKLGLQWYARQQEMLVDALSEQDGVNFARGSDTLRAKWGQKFKSNLNTVDNLFIDSPKIEPLDPKGQPIAMYDGIMGARMADGRRLGDVPEVLEAFHEFSNGLMGEGTYVAPSGSTAKSPEDRLGELNALQADKSSAYYFGPQREVLQAEWRQVWQVVEDRKVQAAKHKAA